MQTMTHPVRTLDDLRGRRVVVLGLARSGVAAARMLAAAGAEVSAYDRRPASELDESVASLQERHVRLALGLTPAAVGLLLGTAELLVTSPSISPDFPTTDDWLREALRDARQRGVDLVSEVELFLRLTRARVLAVTGTKGKTTTTALIGAILDAADLPHAVGGNIGQPLIEQVGLLGPDDWAVLELSELQLPTITRGAAIAVYTNITADHLDRHPSVEAYRAVKARLAELSVPTGRVVLNADDPVSRELGARLPPDAIDWYGIETADRSLAATVDADGWLTLHGERLLPAAELRLPGRHMQADVLAAAVGGSLAGAAPDAIAAAVRGFAGVPHRLELIGEWGGVRWVNDSQATIPVAAIAALRAYAPAPVVLIAGGKDKGLDYAELADAIAEVCRGVVLIGETAATLERHIARRVPTARADSMAGAVASAAAMARPGDVVLLAPAAASFDMFDDYEARGDAFRAAAVARNEAPAGGAQ
ncbi:MAG: UDP-N-acetylmuramoyl-L-alanine--D-glutamate ligase [Chloroflexi bacterium]|nr:MAG: UDP-N-acetylmuramoyl-L-alanine--D-glutamate ligase [Chloroflexota bacterium]